MEPAVTIGLDIAKSVFQVHGIAATGDVVKETTKTGRCRSK